MTVIEPALLGDVGADWTPDRSRDARLAAVFVHGWEGDHVTTWAKKPLLGARKAGLLDYLGADEALHWKLYTVRHDAGAFNPTRMSEIAGLLRAFLEAYVYKHAEGVALIAHSLGGLACRQLIVEEIERFSRRELKIFGLLMFGTPNDGASMARAANLIGSAAGNDMLTYSEPLKRLNANWLERIANGGSPVIDFDNRASILCRNVVGLSDGVVTSASASHMALLGDTIPTSKDHGSLTKPVSENDTPVVFTRDFLHAVEQRFAQRHHDLACDALAAETHARAASASWITRCEVGIELTALDADGVKHFTPGSQLFRSRVTTLKTDVECGSEICIGLRLETQNYDHGTEVDFDQVIGDGVSSNAVSGVLRAGAIEAPLVDVLLAVKLVVRHAGRELRYDAAPRVLQKGGCFVLPFRCDAFPAGVTRVDSLELEVTSILDLAMGWYTYFTTSTITDSLDVMFRSPFRAVCLLPVPLRGNVDMPKPNDEVGGRFETRFQYEGPVNADTRITYIFRR